MAVVRLVILLYAVAIALVILGSWFPMSSDGPAFRMFVFLRRITDPVLEPIRRVIPPVGGVVDLSPTIVLFVLLTLYRVI